MQWADFDVRTLNIVGSMFMSANKDGNFSGITGNFSTVGSSKADVYVTVGIPGTSFGAKVHYRNTMFSQVNADGGGLASSKGSSYWVWA